VRAAGRGTTCCGSDFPSRARCTPRTIEALGCELLTGDAKLKNAAGHHATVIVSR
jgi:hypothetical protein